MTPFWIGAATETVAAVAVPPAAITRPRVPLASPQPTDGVCLLGTARALAGGGRRWRAIPDGNRAVILPDVVVPFAGREWVLGIKGAGALAPLYGELAFADELGAAHSENRGARGIYGEAWFGEAPYGAQGRAGAEQAIALTEMADGASIHGFHVCPVIAVVEVPEEHVWRDRWWYRRWTGTVVQEQRLLPSNVRLFHASPRSVGRSPDEVLDAAGIAPGDAEGFDAFVERYLASGVAALTLWARTLREGAHGLEGLDLDDVWLDKDSVIGSDGTIFFADLEAVEWTPPLAGPDGAARRIRRQIDRNAYELLFGLDALLRAGERRRANVLDAHERRAGVAARLELALAGDRFVRAEARDGGLDLVVTPASRGVGPVTVRLLGGR